jgi:hypothetical protein
VIIMAGQRSYYSNVLTTTRGATLCAARFQINGAISATGTRVLSGRGFTVVSVQNAAGGTNNSITIQVPEKFGTCNLLEVQEVQASATDGTFAAIQTDYSAATGRATFQVGSATGTTFTGSTSPNVVIYVRSEFELGM